MTAAGAMSTTPPGPMTVQEHMRLHLEKEVRKNVSLQLAQSRGSGGGAEESKTSDKLPSHGLNDVYVVLDSWVKDESLSDPSKGLYAFHFNPEGSSDETGVPATDHIKDVIEALFDPVVTPVPIAVSDSGAAHDAATSATTLTSGVAPLVEKTATAATTAALPASTYDNGALGVGATLTADANGLLPDQDSVTLVATDRLVVKDQADQVQNGVYVVTDVGSGASPWILTRATDSVADLVDNSYEVQSGATLSGKTYTAPYSVVLFGTDNVTFAETYSTEAFADPIDSSATALTHPFSHIPLGGRVRAFMREIPRQSYISSREDNHHVEFTAEIVEGSEVTGSGEKQQRMVLTPLSGTDGRFIFSRPLREISKLTVQFFGGEDPLPFPLDRFTALMDLEGGSPRLYWPQSRINELRDRPTADGGGKYFPVEKGDRIFITGVRIGNKSTGAEASELNAHLNRDQGHLVGDLTDVAGGGGNKYFDLFPKMEGLPPSVLGFYSGATGTYLSQLAEVSVRVEKGLVWIPMRFRSVAPSATNTIVAV